MVRLDGVNNVGIFTVTTQQVGSDDRMRPFGLVGEGLADVVQKRRSLALCHVEPQFSRHDPGQVGTLDQVGENVLPEAGAVGKRPDHRQQLRMEIGDPHLQ